MNYGRFYGIMELNLMKNTCYDDSTLSGLDFWSVVITGLRLALLIFKPFGL